MGLHAALLLLVVAKSLVTLLWPPVFALGCIELVRHQFMPGSRSAWIIPVQALLLLLDDLFMGSL